MPHLSPSSHWTFQRRQLQTCLCLKLFVYNTCIPFLHDWLPLAIRCSLQPHRGAFFPWLFYLNSFSFLSSHSGYPFVYFVSSLHFGCWLTVSSTGIGGQNSLDSQVSTRMHYQIKVIFYGYGKIGLEGDRLCPEGKRGRRIITWQQRLSLDDCLLFTWCRAAVFVYVSSALRRSVLATLP